MTPSETRNPPIGSPGTDDAGFRRTLSAFDLTMIGFGSIFGSGWLFAAAQVAGIAGPASLLSWVIAGIAVLLLGLVYCELGAALPRAGGVVRFPEWSHGALPGFLMGLVTTIAFSSLIAIEVVAARQYAGAWIGGLNADVSGNPTWLGWAVQMVVLAVLLFVNRAGITTFAAINNIVTIFKFCVPVLVAGILLAHLHASNFTAHGFAPGGSGGIEAAISVGGIIFAYLGLTPIVSVASEARDPQRDIPAALIASVSLAMLVYVLLQAAFIGGLTESLIGPGWAGLSHRMALPFHDIALALGFGWLASLVVADAMISPTGTANVYMSATPRIIYGWAQVSPFLPAMLRRVDPASGVPRPALLLTFVLAVFWTLPFPSWQALIGIVSSALMMSYALAPLSAAALRRTASDLPRPFRLRGFAILSPAAFAIASLIVFWTGWPILRWLLGLQTFACLAALLTGSDGRTRRWQNAWLPAWLIGLLVFSWAGSFGGRVLIPHPVDDLVVAGFALAIYAWAERAGLDKPSFSSPALSAGPSPEP